jgi:hypothetical protein
VSALVSPLTLAGLVSADLNVGGVGIQGVLPRVSVRAWLSPFRVSDGVWVSIPAPPTLSVDPVWWTQGQQTSSRLDHLMSGFSILE